MSKKPQLSIYRLCLKSGTFDKQKPTFVIKAGNKFQKKINTYFIASDKQRYNYDLLIEKSPDTDIMIHCDVGQQLLGTAILKVDSRKTDQPNETLSVMNSKKQKIATLDCSLKKLQKKTKKPAIIIQVIQASYVEQESKQPQNDSQSFIVLKYGDANYQTKPTDDTIDHAPVWKENFHSAASEADRIFVQIWKKVDKQNNKFQGLALLQVSKAIGNQKDYEIMFDKKKKGTIKIAVYQDKADNKQVDLKINDKNFVKKRTIKAYILQTLLKDPSKKGTFVRLLSSISGQKFETSQSFQSSKQLSFNEAFTLVVNQNQQIEAHLIMNDGMEEQMARASLKVKDIQNKKYELKLLDGQQNEIGTIYLQFFDQDLDIKQEISQNISQVAVSEPTKAKQSIASKISEKTAAKLGQTAEEMKARYANRQSIHDYMNEVNIVLQQGLLKIAKQRPQNPIKQLGLYLINFRKD